MKLRPVKIYIDNVLVAKHVSDKPLGSIIDSFVRSRRIAGIHLDGRTMKVVDERGAFDEKVAGPRRQLCRS